MKTYSLKTKEIARRWYLVDATGVPLGRLATVVANQLVGKNKPSYTPHIDNGDNVIVVNAAKVGVTGNKLADKKYYRHSGYPGGIKETTLGTIMETQPERAIEKAVRGMLPKNRLQAQRQLRLKVYGGANHPHDGQNPTALEINHG